MSIKMIWIEDLICPCFVCDTCGETIHNARLAAAVFNMLAKEAHIDVKHVHKGKCLDVAEKLIGRGFGWAELTQHITFLESNARRKDKE